MSKITPEKSKEYRETRKKKHPILVRKMNTDNCRKYRNDPANKEKWKKNNSKFFANWLKKDPINAITHKCRTKLGSLKLTLLKSPYGAENLKEESRKIYEAVTAIGWSPYLNKNISLNHVVSLRLIYSFNKNVPYSVCYDVANIELIPSELNNSVKKRLVTQKVRGIARKLEKLYPFYLSGFGDFVDKHRGTVI
jgi:hypothetical protein